MPRCTFISHTDKPKELHKGMPEEKYFYSRFHYHKQKTKQIRH